MRGVLTADIQKVSKDFLGREITQLELRLFPYISFVMLNSQKLEISKINQEERKILADWRERKLIEGGAGGLSITQEFWDFMNKILWYGYVVGGAINE